MKAKNKTVFIDMNELQKDKDLVSPDHIRQLLQLFADDEQESELLHQGLSRNFSYANDLLGQGLDVVVQLRCNPKADEVGYRVIASITAVEAGGAINHEVLENRRNGGSPVFLRKGCASLGVQNPEQRGFDSHYAEKGKILANQLSAYALTQIYPFNNDQKFAPLPQGLELLHQVQRHLNGEGQERTQEVKLETYLPADFTLPTHSFPFIIDDKKTVTSGRLYHGMLAAPYAEELKQQFFLQVQETFQNVVPPKGELHFTSGRYDTLCEELRRALRSKVVMYSGWIVHTAIVKGSVPEFFCTYTRQKRKGDEQFAIKPKTPCNWVPMSVKFSAGDVLKNTLVNIRDAYVNGATQRGHVVDEKDVARLLESIEAQMRFHVGRVFSGDWILTTETKDQLCPGLRKVIHESAYQNWIIHTGAVDTQSVPGAWMTSSF